MSAVYYEIQTARYTDHIAADGHEMTKLPKPFFVEPDGSILRQDYWEGTPLRVVGFTDDLSRQQVDLRWADALATGIEKTVGMYLVTKDKDGTISGHLTAVDKVVEHIRQERSE